MSTAVLSGSLRSWCPISACVVRVCRCRSVHQVFRVFVKQWDLPHTNI